MSRVCVAPRPWSKQIDGHAVLKTNMYDLQSGERSVFQQELSRE